MQLYADENLPLAMTEALRRLGHDVLTAYDDGRANQAMPDDKVLLRATELKRAVLTLNRVDFKRLHAAHPQHAGIVSCTYDPDFAGQAARIHQALQSMADITGQLVRINRGG
jgi:hypothetical protein